ncbi:DNA repair protein RadC [Rhodobacteraceae bacterium RKSG542]|uniref:RadC family protein n=1 Tax=Pseudovibrio flavus TaxID=2529854 RepID=UPI0012BD043E|nr:DNA repair protein RadC [Pseudovibrio flavus]MTI19343.1 DNA repair protein RadC [Pseudovibrio flavus]
MKDDTLFEFAERASHTPLQDDLQLSAKKAGPKKQSKHYHGHRERLKSRFEEAGPQALASYEMLEMLLYLSIKQGDTKPLAKALLARFGSFADVLAAPKERLMEVEGCGPQTARMLKLLEASAVLYAKDQINTKKPLSSWSAVLDYIHTAMARNEREEFRILFLDKKNNLVADEVQQKGTIDHTPVYPREVAKRSLELGACAVILVHNHPSGDPTPSRSDIQMTKKVASVLEPLSIVLHDHIIISRGGHVSFRALQLLDD